MDTATSFDVICFFKSVDYWAYRYQSAFVGLVAFSIALQQLRISKSQASISHQQSEIAKTQRETEVSLARVSVDRLLEQSFRIYNRIVEMTFHEAVPGQMDGAHQIWSFRTDALMLFSNIEIPVDFTQSAAKAFPQHAHTLERLRLTIEDARELLKEFSVQPWAWAHVGEQLSGRDLEMSNELNDVLNRFFRYTTALSHVNSQLRG